MFSLKHSEASLSIIWGSTVLTPLLYKYVKLSLCVFVIDGVVLDGDDPEHIQWVYQKSVERAAEFNITGVTYRLTQGEHTYIAQLSLTTRTQPIFLLLFWEMSQSRASEYSCPNDVIQVLYLSVFQKYDSFLCKQI